MKIPKARPIEDVNADLTKLLVRMLPGSQAVGASWSALCQAWEMVRHSEYVRNSYAEQPEPDDPMKKFVRDSIIFGEHGKYYAACTVIRAIADAFKVPNVTWIEVEDGQEGEAVGAAESGAATN